ncbi:MAG TPA: exopolysaccharide biosynthesis polyprenyl glycosylphosphotransferase [Anaerolineaceae bacterium]|nr:exopolysaccharide biosynthesis polyprenyl glycosylphosphotransferase [Anaerolineaceae bacterium]HPN53025.1 exopolysaccharide biosynthesis polyprenyl glycosylphosphotransferase [Anaerolineaceae bacterium]
MKPVYKSASFRLKPSEQRFVLLVGDIVMSAAALFAALYYWYIADNLTNFSVEFLQYRPAFWFYLLPLLWLLLLVELYDQRRASNVGDTLRGIGLAAAICTILYLLVYFTADPNSLPRRGVAGFIVAVTVLTIIWRMLYIRIFTSNPFMRRVLIVGAGKAGTALAEVIKNVWPTPFVVVGLVDDDPRKLNTTVHSYPVLGGSGSLWQIIENEHVTDLVLAISHDLNSDMLNAILVAQERGVAVTSMPKVYEEILGRVPIFFLESDWIIRSFVEQARSSALYDLAKRLMDILGGLIGTLGLVLMFPFVALAIVIDSGFPVFFLQNRLGQGGQIYRIIKFRTMRTSPQKNDQPQVTKHKDDRITRVGWFLRKTHIDEFPQFINVLRGEMSLVGPRAEQAELVADLQSQIPFYRARLLVKPGISGWAQVNFGYAATVEDTAIKLEYDLYYIKHRTLLLDLVILLRTVGTVVGFRGQ